MRQKRLTRINQSIRVLSFNKTSSSSSVSTMGLDNVHHRTSDSSTDVMSADDDDDTVELWSEQQRLQLEENIEALGLGERINL
jgi:hypothetical protein